MAYREGKIKVDDRIKRIKRICLCAVVFLLVAMLVFSFFYPPESWKYYFSLPKVGTREEGQMRVHFVDVGQGDCTIIELPDGKTMLVDGGASGAKTEKVVLRYLNALEIDVIDHLVITHADDDHCGAIAEVVRQKRVVNAYLPASPDIKSGAYAEAHTELLKEDCTLLKTDRTLDLSQGGDTPYTLSFLYPYAELEERTSNDLSSVFWLDYLGVSFLFAADAPAEVEELLMRDDSYGFLKDKKVDLTSTEILKVAHHGGAQSSSMAFLSYLNVREGIISCGKNNPYNHPADIVLEKLEMVGATAHRTDESGNIILTVHADGGYGFATVKSK